MFVMGFERIVGENFRLGMESFSFCEVVWLFFLRDVCEVAWLFELGFVFSSVSLCSWILFCFVCLRD